MCIKRPGLLMLVLFVAMSALGITFLLSPAPSAFAASDRAVAGHVYVLNNTADVNSISAFNRASGGKLTFVGTSNIGGQGSGSGLGSQGSLVLSPDRNWLFAVDAGSNQISVVAVDSDGSLQPAGVFSSGGVHPVSLTYTNGRLYVVNAGDSSNAANVTGFRVGTDGKLHHITGSTRPLSAANPAPAQVQANPAGDVLVVTEKATNVIDTYQIHSDGKLSGPQVTPSTGAEPFGFAFSPLHTSQFIVSDAFGGAANAGAVTSYALAGTSVQLLDGPVADNQTAPCWVVITGNGRFAYTTNTGSGTVSGYRVGSDGSLTLLAPASSTGAGSSPTEMALSSGSQFLYVLDSGTATLSGFQVQSDGSLVDLGLSGITLPASSTGLAAD